MTGVFPGDHPDDIFLFIPVRSPPRTSSRRAGWHQRLSGTGMTRSPDDAEPAERSVMDGPTLTIWIIAIVIVAVLALRAGRSKS